jgi:hypothetical protein
MLLQLCGPSGRVAAAPCYGARTPRCISLAVGGAARRRGAPAARATATATVAATVAAVEAAEAQLLEALRSAKGRGKEGLSAEQQARIAEAVALLEADGGVKAPAAAGGLLDGYWRLLYTSRPGTSSPIQRTFTGVEAFSIFQEVTLSGREPRVNNVVVFGDDIGFLKVR